MALSRILSPIQSYTDYTPSQKLFWQGVRGSGLIE